MEAPVFLRTPEPEYYVQYGESPTFDCAAVGRPEPRMQWYKDGRLLEKKDGYEFGEPLTS